MLLLSPILKSRPEAGARFINRAYRLVLEPGRIPDPWR